MVALGVPFLSMRQGTADYSVDPTSTTTTTYRGYEMLVHGFGPGFSGPLQIVAPLPSPADRAAFDYRGHRCQPHERRGRHRRA